MADDIKIRIGLQGDEDVKRRLDAVRDAGKKSSEDIAKSMNQAVSTWPALGKAINVEQDLERNRVAAERFREAIHTAHPILAQAGIEIAGLGSYARLAGAGLGALGAAIVGSIVVALAKMSEETAKAQQRFADLARSSEAGKKLFEGIQKSAAATGTDAKGAGNYVENLLHLRDKLDAKGGVIRVQGKPVETGPLNDESIVAAEKVLTQRGILGGLPADKSKELAGAFGQSLYQNEHLTPELLEQVSKASPGLANYLSQLFGGHGETEEKFKLDLERGRFRDLKPDEINRRLAGQAETTQSEFDKRPKYIGDYTEQAKAASERGLERATEGVTSFARGEGIPLPTADTLADAISRRASGQFGVGQPNVPETGGGLSVRSLLTPPPQAPIPVPTPAPLPKVYYGQQQTPGYDRTSDGLLIRNEEAVAPPLATPATLGPRSENAPPAAADQATPAAIGQLASTVSSGDSATQSTLSSGFQAVVSAIAALANRRPEKPTDTPPQTVGVRGADGGYIKLDDGGHIRGPGTSTSDSIPAMLSDGEYVVKADTVKKIGVGRLNSLNRNPEQYLKMAGGGVVGSLEELGI